MEFQVGDPVMHWTYGFGQVIDIDERIISDKKTLYYAISIRDLTVWVPADDHLDSRLRVPTSSEEFPKLFEILTGPSRALPEDRQERKLMLLDTIKDGKASSLCRLLRDLADHQQKHSLNDNDQTIMKRTREALLSEWVHALSVPVTVAEAELKHLLSSGMNSDVD